MTVVHIGRGNYLDRDRAKTIYDRLTKLLTNNSGPKITCNGQTWTREVTEHITEGWRRALDGTYTDEWYFGKEASPVNNEEPLIVPRLQPLSNQEEDPYWKSIQQDNLKRVGIGLDDPMRQDDGPFSVPTLGFSKTNDETPIPGLERPNI